MDLGPICPFDGQPALLHFAGRPGWMLDYLSKFDNCSDHLMRSFNPRGEDHPHEYEECLDCDTYTHYDDDYSPPHCGHCQESPEDCDGTPYLEGSKKSHERWPEGMEWWRSVCKLARELEEKYDRGV
jgi:hypothetical protein